MKASPVSTPHHKLEITACGVSLAIVTAVACWPMFATNLQADDFCRSNRVAQSGVIESTQHDYLTFTGRWLGFGLEYTVLSQIQSQPGYGLVLAGIALVYFVALWCLIGALFRQLSATLRTLLAGILFGLYWVGLPSTKDSFYWLCGSIEYQLSLALAVLAIAATICATRRGEQGNSFLVCWLFAMLAAVATSGMHELYGLMLCIVLGTGSLLVWKLRMAGRTIWLVVTGFALAGFLFAFLAPGNAARSANLENSGQLWIATKVALAAMAQTLPDWVFNFRLLVATLLLVACFPAHRLAGTWLNDQRKHHLRWVIPVVWMLLLLGAFLGPAYGTGHVVASRTLSAAFMIFLLGWFLNWLLILAWLQSRAIQLIVLHPLAKTAVVLLLAASLVFTGTTRRVMRELAGPIPSYAAAKAEWHAQLLKAGQAGEEHVVLPAIVDPPGSIGFSDITADPNHWINRCAAEYFGVESVRVVTPPTAAQLEPRP